MKRAMIRQRYRPEEIVAMLRETDEALAQGKSPEDVAKSLGVSLMTLHRWRTEYGSTDRDAVKCLKELERENSPSRARTRSAAARYELPFDARSIDECDQRSRHERQH